MVDEDGRKILSYVVLSDEVLNQQAALQVAKSKYEIQRMQRKDCDELLNIAQTRKFVGYSLKEAQKEVLEAEQDMKKKNAICRDAQAVSGKATKDYKEALYRLRKLLKGPDED